MHWSFISCHIENDNPVLSIQTYCYTTQSPYIVELDMDFLFELLSPCSIFIALLLNSEWEYCVRKINEGCMVSVHIDGRGSCRWWLHKTRKAVLLYVHVCIVEGIVQEYWSLEKKIHPVLVPNREIIFSIENTLYKYCYRKYKLLPWVDLFRSWGAVWFTNAIN